MTSERNGFSALLSTPPPPRSPEALREARWRRIFDERGLVWASHNLITPRAASLVEAEKKRVADGGPARAVHTGEARDVRFADAAALLTQGGVPAVELGPSELPVGLGLFASQDLSAGQLVGEYTGLVCLLDDVEERGAYAYEAWPGSLVAIDACTAGNHTRFVNHSPTPNLDVLQCVIAGAWRVLFVTRASIPAGEELFIHYGESYWRRRRMSRTRAR